MVLAIYFFIYKKEEINLSSFSFLFLILIDEDCSSEQLIMSIYYNEYNNEYIMSIVVTNLHLKTSKSALLCKNLHFNIFYYNFV